MRRSSFARRLCRCCTGHRSCTCIATQCLHVGASEWSRRLQVERSRAVLGRVVLVQSSCAQACVCLPLHSASPTAPLRVLVPLGGHPRVANRARVQSPAGHRPDTHDAPPPVRATVHLRGTWRSRSRVDTLGCPIGSIYGTLIGQPTRHSNMDPPMRGTNMAQRKQGSPARVTWKHNVRPCKIVRPTHTLQMT